MKRSLFFTIVIVLTILFTWDRSSALPATHIIAATSAATSTPTGVPAGRVARLARGVNMTEWFWAPTGLARHFASSDFALIRQLGFTYVRLPIGLNTLFAESSADLLNHSRLADIDGAIQQALSHGLAISLDIHSIAGLEENPQFIDRFVQFWASFAAHLSTADPEMVFIEPLNEPIFSGRYDAWYTIQARLITAIRARAPRHTLIATSPYRSAISTFVKMQPLTDPNVIYNFHFYEPILFTHQGADWSSPLLVGLRGVPYPSNPEVIKPDLDRATNPFLQTWLRLYGRQRWASDRVAALIGQAAAWGNTHGVPVICNEFGVYRLFADAQSRFQWLYDVRTALDKYRIGWAVWDYEDTNSQFGLVTRYADRIAIDEDIARALNLTGYAAAAPEPMQPTQQAATSTPFPTVEPSSAPGKIYRVESGGFSFQTPGGFEAQIQTAQVTVMNQEETISLYMAAFPRGEGQSSEAMLSQFLPVLQGLEDFKAGATYPATVDQLEGLAVDVSGKLSGARVAGEIVVIPRGQSFLVACGSAVDEANDTLWKAEGIKAFHAILGSTKFLAP